MKILILSLLLTRPVYAKELDIIQKYIEATRSNDPEKLKAILHPKSLECISEGNKEFYNSIFIKISSRPVPEVYDQKTEKPDVELLKKQITYLFGEDSILPVVPHKRITLRYELKDTTQPHGCRKFHERDGKISVVDQIDLAQDGDKLGWVVACVGKKAVDQFKAKPMIEKEANESAKAMLKAIGTDLKADLIKEIKSGKTLSAIKLYEAKAKRTRTEAVRVLDLLCDEI